MQGDRASDARRDDDLYRALFDATDEAAHPRPAATAAPSENTQELSGQRVLIVDDNRDAARTLAMLLGLCGAQTQVEHDGESGLARLEHWLPSAVLLDLGMPGMDGTEMARRIRADRRFDAVALVAITGWGQDADRRRTREAGFDHHLTKPVALDTLLATLLRDPRITGRENRAGDPRS